MPTWDEGYVSDVVYTSNFHRETTPTWIAAAALLLGHRPPDLTRPFCYADLGCGHGLTATVVAATFPHADVWGFDFNPAHVESARALAARAGLTNVRFQETSFAELTALPQPALPSFDFLVAHGVMSWVSPQNQAQVVDLIGQRLRPGGLAYLSYNVATGWGAMPPLRTLMRSLMLAAGDRTDRAASGVLDYLDGMRQAGARFFAANPTLEPRLTEIRQQNPRYIAHEFLNQDWHPLMFADVADRMAAAKCGYIGSATLAENIDLVSVPEAMVSLIAATPDPVLRETLRDFAAAQAFRRDLYRRGTLAMPGPEQARLLDALTLEWVGTAITDPISLPTPLGTVVGAPELYGPLVKLLTANPRTFGELSAAAGIAGRPAADVLQAVTLLMSAGYVHPALPLPLQAAGHAGADRLNAAIGLTNADGGEIYHLASPVIGSAVPVDLLETLTLQEPGFSPDMPDDGLTDRLLAALGRAGRSVQRDGKPLTDPNQARVVLDETVRTLAANRRPLLRRLGIAPAAP